MTKLAVLIATTIAVITTPAQAEVLFSIAPELGSRQGAYCMYNTVCGTQLSGNTYAAQRFTLAADATVNVFGFNAGVSENRVPGGPRYGTAVNFRVLSATAGDAPGSVIAAGSAALRYTTGPGGDYFSTTDYSFEVAPLDLAAGSYFVAFQNVTANFNDYLSRGTASSGAYQSDDGGLTFTPGYGGMSKFASVAISVRNEPVSPGVPEPSNWALMLMGFGTIGAGLRSRRRVASFSTS